LADQLRKGVVEEEVNQNVEKAIQAYQSIVARYDEDRKAAGTALYRLAECYRKAGKRDQAVAAYQRVAREFADQSAIAEPSRQQLTALGVSEPREVRPERASTAGVRASREAPRAVRPDSGPAREVRPESPPAASQAGGDLEATKQQLAAMDSRRADMAKKIQAGMAAPADAEALEAEYRALLVRYRQQEREALGRRELNNRLIKSVEQEILLVQARIADIEKKVSAGTVSPQDAELLQLRRDLLGLQRKLDELRLQRDSIR
jgi:tetratricopeptide (TPR) repeat protein